ncbi:MAG: hypothetical protein E6J30_09330 [Chloroflexi bacterium]|nr:MAG: hypothetical protein E6J30_09330 [Chloroflexota bacterium]
MLDTAVALAAGAAVAVAVLAAFAPRVRVDEVPGGPWLRRRWSRWWASEAALAQLAVAIVGAVVAASATGLIALALPGAIGSVAVVRLIVGRRAHAARIRRQDAVLESVRMLRQLLETGAAGVQQAIAVLAERGPEPLRQEFRLIAVLVQRPGGGELAPLFADLEATVAGAQEVEREADALQVQARSAAAIIVSLPVAFLLVPSALRSPYLDAFHQPAGEAFLLLMLAVMGASYVWMRRLLRLDGLQRVRLVDA